MIVTSSNSKCVKKIEDGELYRSQGKLQEALSCFNEAIALDSNCPEAWNYKGLTILTSADQISTASVQIGTPLHDDAIICFDEAIRLDRNYPEAWYHKANALVSRLDYSGALNCFDNSLSINPSHARTSWYIGGAPVWYNKGNLLATRFQEYQEAINCYDKAISLDPDYPEAWKNMGVSWLLLERFEEAVNSFNKALDCPYARNYAWSWTQNTIEQKIEALEALGLYADAAKERKYLDT